MSERFILASASPRRRELLTLSGYSFEVMSSHASELTGGISASELVRLNALAKARDIFLRVGGDKVVLGADTVVCLNGCILGKPHDADEAFAMLKSLSGSTHSVLTGYAVVSHSGEKSGFCETLVNFRNIPDEEIKAYIATGEPLDKAGAYGIQERGGLFAESVSGDFFNIIGLPVEKIYPILAENGIYPDWQKAKGID